MSIDNSGKDELDWLYNDDQNDASAEYTSVLNEQDLAHMSYADHQLRTNRLNQYPESTNRNTGFTPAYGEYRNPIKAPKKHHFIRNSIFTLVFAWLLFMIGTPIYALLISNKVPDKPANRPADHPGTAILLAGLDSYAALLNPNEKDETTSGHNQRADTIMLLYSPSKGKPVLIGIPRDSYLPIPGKKKSKINASYAWGGPKLLIQTVEQNTGIRINGYLEIGFGGVMEAVDALGGIEICRDTPLVVPQSELNLKTGCQIINGRTALNYARMRMQDPKGDLGRMARQREIIGKIIAKATSWKTILNPIKYFKINTALARTINRGEDTGFEDLITAAKAFKAVSTDKDSNLSIPISNANKMINGQSVVIWDKERAKKIFDQIIAGKTEDLHRITK